MIILIAAIAKNGVIGKTGEQLPWRIPEEIKMFKTLTTGNVVVMGRKTFESIGKPLPSRVNIVVSRSFKSREGIEVSESLKEALEKAKDLGKDIFIIGGAQIFEQSMGFADKLYLSHLKKDYAGDTNFPEFRKEDWEIERNEDHEEFEFVIYSKVSS